MFIFHEERKYIMFGALWGLFVVLVVLWLLGFVVFHVGSFLIHILLILAVIVLVYNLVMRARTRRL
ncbi:MAG: lmo0937 family membrane protein [Ktedonobacteraceae bacterium]